MNNVDFNSIVATTIGVTGYYNKDKNTYVCVICDAPLLSANGYRCVSSTCNEYKKAYKHNIITDFCGYDYDVTEEELENEREW